MIHFSHQLENNVFLIYSSHLGCFKEKRLLYQQLPSKTISIVIYTIEKTRSSTKQAIFKMEMVQFLRTSPHQISSTLLCTVLEKCSFFHLRYLIFCPNLFESRWKSWFIASTNPFHTKALLLQLSDPRFTRIAWTFILASFTVPISFSFSLYMTLFKFSRSSEHFLTPFTASLLHEWAHPVLTTSNLLFCSDSKQPFERIIFAWFNPPLSTSTYSPTVGVCQQ